MKLTQLRNFFDEHLFVKELKQFISTEVTTYITLLNKNGSGVPIMLDEDIDLILGNQELIILCKAFIDGELSEYELSYIADALLLSNKVVFESEHLLDMVETLTEPFVNDKLTKEMVTNVLL